MTVDAAFVGFDGGVSVRQIAGNGCAAAFDVGLIARAVVADFHTAVATVGVGADALDSRVVVDFDIGRLTADAAVGGRVNVVVDAFFDADFKFRSVVASGRGINYARFVVGCRDFARTVVRIVSDMRDRYAVLCFVGQGVPVRMCRNVAVIVNIDMLMPPFVTRENGLRRMIRRGDFVGNFVSFFNGFAQMVVNERVDGFGNLVVCISRRCRDRQQACGAGGDFQPRLFRTAVLFDFFDAGNQTVRVFDCAQSNTRRARPRNHAQSVLPERHQFLASFAGFQKFENRAFFTAFLFVFCKIFAHGCNGRRRFERRKHGTQNNRGGSVRRDFRRDIGFGEFLLEFAIQPFDAADKSGILETRFDFVGKSFCVRHGAAQRRAHCGVAVGFGVGQIETGGDLVGLI